MTNETRGRWTVVYRAALLVAILIISTAGSYILARVLRADTASRNHLPAAMIHTDSGTSTTSAGADSMYQNPFRSGRYLVAYVLVASDCGFSNEKLTKKAIREFGDSLRVSQGEVYTHVSVVGVSIDTDLDAGIKFLQEIRGSGTVFDEISVGGNWLNEHITRLVWREGMATPNLPQVVLIERRVDADAYPRHMELHRDSVLLNVIGRNDLVAWVNSGTPLDFRRGTAISITK